MDSEFPANTHKARQGPAEKKEVGKVIEGSAIRRKKPMGRRFTELFIAGDSRSVSQYVMLEVLLPAIKDMLTDAMSQGFERLIYGESRGPSRRPSGRNHGPSGYVSYNRYSAAPAREERRPMSRQARAQHNFDEIILPTRREADDVLEGLNALLERYDSVTVSDLYELVGETSNFADEKWGWVDLRGATVARVRDGYLLDLPKPTTLD